MRTSWRPARLNLPRLASSESKFASKLWDIAGDFPFLSIRDHSKSHQKGDAARLRAWFCRQPLPSSTLLSTSWGDACCFFSRPCCVCGTCILHGKICGFFARAQDGPCDFSGWAGEVAGAHTIHNEHSICLALAAPQRRPQQHRLLLETLLRPAYVIFSLAVAC